MNTHSVTYGLSCQLSGHTNCRQTHAAFHQYGMITWIAGDGVGPENFCGDWDEITGLVGWEKSMATGWRQKKFMGLGGDGNNLFCHVTHCQSLVMQYWIRHCHIIIVIQDHTVEYEHIGRDCPSAFHMASFCTKRIIKFDTYLKSLRHPGVGKILVPRGKGKGQSINQSINQSTFVKHHKSQANRRREVLSKS